MRTLFGTLLRPRVLISSKSATEFIIELLSEGAVPADSLYRCMTGPSGDQPQGYWDVLDVEPPRRILFRDCCDSADGTPRPINTIRVGIEEVAQRRTRMSIEIVFASTEAMEQA